MIDGIIKSVSILRDYGLNPILIYEPPIDYPILTFRIEMPVRMYNYDELTHLIKSNLSDGCQLRSMNFNGLDVIIFEIQYRFELSGKYQINYRNLYYGKRNL